MENTHQIPSRIQPHPLLKGRVDSQRGIDLRQEEGALQPSSDCQPDGGTSDEDILHAGQELRPIQKTWKHVHTGYQGLQECESRGWKVEKGLVLDKIIHTE